MVAGLVLLVLLVLGVAWFFLLRTVYKPVFTDLQPADAATIATQLEKDKIPYRLGEGGADILVPEDQAGVARMKIMGSDLPFRGTVGLELFGKSDMGMTDFAQKINYQRALQGELARTIMAIDGVDSARVHLALGEDRIFRDDRVPPKASIMVRMRGNAAIPAPTAEGIQRLAAAAINQLDPGNVVVLDEQGRIVSAAVSSAGLSPVIAARQAVEAWYEARIRQAIEPVAVGEDIKVTVRAGLLQRPAGASSSGGLPDWDIGVRNFRLEVTLSPRTEPARQTLDKLRSLTRQAIDFDADKGDMIVFGTWHPVDQPAPTVGDAAPVWDRPAEARDPKTEADGMPITIAALLAFLCAAGLGALAWARRRRRMSDAERIAFADRLNALLQEDEERLRHASG